MTITAEELERDKALCEKATRGPWYTRPGPDPEIVADKHGASEWLIASQIVTDDDTYGGGESEIDRNAAFIVAARQGWPKYIAEVERLNVAHATWRREAVEAYEAAAVSDDKLNDAMDQLKSKDAEIARLNALLEAGREVRDTLIGEIVPEHLKSAADAVRKQLRTTR